MTEALLTLVIIASLLVHVWYIKKYHELQKSLINALLSKDVHEFVAAEKVLDNKEAKEEVPSEFISTADLDDDEFFNAIEKTVDYES